VNLVEALDGTYINLDQLCSIKIFEPHPSWPPEKRLFRVNVQLPPTGDFSSSGKMYELGNGFPSRETAIAEMIAYVQGERALNRR
jgi:hypothetical protein